MALNAKVAATFLLDERGRGGRGGRVTRYCRDPRVSSSVHRIVQTELLVSVGAVVSARAEGEAPVRGAVTVLAPGALRPAMLETDAVCCNTSHTGD